MWFGKIIGASFGALVLGPLGILIGLWIGHQFDKGLVSFSAFSAKTHSLTQTAFFSAIFSVLGHLAKADGHVSKKEIQIAELIMEKFNLTPALRQEAIRLFNLGKSADFNLEATLQELKKRCHNNPALLQLFVDIQLQMMQIDPESSNKQQILQKICQTLGVRPFAFYSWHFKNQHQQSQQQHQQHYGHQTHFGKPASVDPYTVLGINRSTPPADIKKAYRKLMNQNHPDKLVAKGLPQEMLKLATEKTQAIQAAYETIRQERGF